MYKEIPLYMWAIYNWSTHLSKTNQYEQLEQFYIDMGDTELCVFIDLFSKFSINGK